MLDGLLHHESSLIIREPYTDTGGATEHVFGLCHLLGFRLRCAFPIWPTAALCFEIIEDHLLVGFGYGDFLELHVARFCSAGSLPGARSLCVPSALDTAA